MGVTAACARSTSQDLNNKVVLGALLPFTGGSSGLGLNLENALLMFEDKINSTPNGLLGKKLALVEQDTGSNAQRGTVKTRSIVDIPGALGLLGPEDPTLAVQIAPIIQSAGIVNILPGNAAPKIPDPSQAGLWFRTGPSSASVAAAMAAHLQTDGVRSVLILFEPDTYGSELSTFLRCQIQAVLQISARMIPLAGSVSSVVAYASQDTYDAICLIANPEVAAQVVTEQTLLGTHSVHWYFSPTLDSPAFIDNVAPSSVSNALGLSPALSPTAAEFTREYRSRWSEEPLIPAYYYYDAAMVWALATEAAAFGQAGEPTANHITSALRTVSSPPGEAIGWNDLAHGLDLVRQGIDIDYDGLSGPLDIGGSDDAGQSILRFWKVPNGSIQYLDPFDYAQALASQCE